MARIPYLEEITLRISYICILPNTKHWNTGTNYCFYLRRLTFAVNCIFHIVILWSIFHIGSINIFLIGYNANVYHMSVMSLDEVVYGMNWVN